MANVKQLTDSGDRFYPATIVAAIKDETNGKTLRELLNELHIEASAQDETISGDIQRIYETLEALRINVNDNASDIETNAQDIDNIQLALELHLPETIEYNSTGAAIRTATGELALPISAATQSNAGLLSAADKTKLDGISSSGSYVLPVASSETLGGIKIASPFFITGNGELGVSERGNATQSAAGYMSAADKTKLDGLSNYTLPVATTARLGGVKAGSGVEVDNSGTISVPTATATNDGLMPYTSFSQVQNNSNEIGYLRSIVNTIIAYNPTLLPSYDIAVSIFPDTFELQCNNISSSGGTISESQHVDVTHLYAYSYLTPGTVSEVDPSAITWNLDNDYDYSDPDFPTISARRVAFLNAGNTDPSSVPQALSTWSQYLSGTSYAGGTFRIAINTGSGTANTPLPHNCRIHIEGIYKSGGVAKLVAVDMPVTFVQQSNS